MESVVFDFIPVDNSNNNNKNNSNGKNNNNSTNTNNNNNKNQNSNNTLPSQKKEQLHTTHSSIDQIITETTDNPHNVGLDNDRIIIRNNNMQYDTTDTTTMNFFEKHTKNRTIVMTSHKRKDCSVVRLERVPGSRSSLQGCIEYEGRVGHFKDIVVVNGNKRRLTKVCKPHVHTTFFTHVRHTNGGADDDCDKFVNTRKERRSISLWTYKGIQRDHQVFIGSCFVRRLLQPETFPPDMLAFIKKVLVLMRECGEMRRVEVKVVLLPQMPEEVAVEVPLIENFITVLTPPLYDYQYLPEVPVSRKTHVCFRLMASGDGHVALSYVYGDTDRRTYEVVIGGRGNSMCAIRYGGKGEIKVERHTENILDGDNYKDFWIGWKGGVVSLGVGSEVGSGLLLEWRDIPPSMRHAINLLSVSTGPASPGKWEFVEYIVPYEEANESKKERMRKVLKKLVWWGKKEKIIQRLEEAFPSPLGMPELLRLSTVSLSNMLEAVVFLKKAHEEGSVREISRGVWLRSPFQPSDSHHEIIRISSLPRFLSQTSPTIAIITSLFVEKMAVDVMMEEQEFYMLEGHGIPPAAYSIGRMAGKVVVLLKLPRFCALAASQPMHSQVVEGLLDHFIHITSVIVVGVGGGVPNFNDVSKHVRRGDVIISCPRDHDGSLYVHCPSVEDDAGADPSGRSAFFATSHWTASSSSKLQRAVRTVVKDGLTGKQAWQKHLDDACERLSRHDQRFFRPAQKTDKLFCQLSKTEPILAFEHPTALHATAHTTPHTTAHKTLHSGVSTACEVGRGRVLMGTIGSGNCVSTDLVYRRLFAQQNHISAYDIGLSYVMEALFRSRVGGENVVMVLGVSDYLNGSKTKSWQPHSSLAASAVCKALFELL